MSDITELSVCDYESDSDLMDDLQSRRQLLGQIAELQNAVEDMKSAFTVAIQRLSQVPQDEQSLWTKVEENRAECQTQVSEVLKLMLTMKADFAALKTQVQQSSDVQQSLRRQIQNLMWERNTLIEELHKSGSVSDQTWYSFNRNVRPVGRASSGSHSNDSGVVMLQTAYHPPPTPYLMSSDQESSLSMMESPLTLSNAMVRDYVARHSQSQPTQPSYGEVQVLTAYDSDSSLVNAANKSLTLSTSLGKQCGLELDQCEVDGTADSELEEEDEDVTHAKRNWDPRKAVADALEEGGKESSVKNLQVDAEGPNENVRLRLAKEVVESERKYCGMLHTLLRTFAEPLTKAGIISIKDVNTLFPDEINQLYYKHSSLCHTLEDKIQTWARNSTLGDVFDNFTDPLESNVLQLYTSYIDDFPEVLKTFHKLCRKSAKFTQFLKSCLSRPACGGLDLGVFLVAPVQRIPQYILLLKRLLKVVDCGHPDNMLINSCLHRLKDSLNRLNDTMEHSFQLISAQIQQEEDMDCMAVSGWPITVEVDPVRHRMSDVNIGDEMCVKRSSIASEYAAKKKVHNRGFRTTSKMKDHVSRGPSALSVDTEDLTGTKPKQRVECRSVSVQSNLNDDEDKNCGEMSKTELKSEVEIFNKSVNNQREDEEQSKPVKSKPPVKPCRFRVPGKVEKSVESTDKSPFVKSDVSNLRSNSESVAYSEPNLAQEQQISMDPPLECPSRVTPYKNIEKGGSLGCILTTSVVTDDANRIQRPLGKSESSYTIHQVTVPGANSALPASKSIPVIASSSSVTQPQIKQKTNKHKLKDKKLVSIRASLKNILTFRKRGSEAVLSAGNKSPQINKVSTTTANQMSDLSNHHHQQQQPVSAMSEVHNQICIVLRRDDDVGDDPGPCYECCQSGNSCSHTCSTV